MTGEHTDEILEELLGLDQAARDKMREDGIL